MAEYRYDIDDFYAVDGNGKYLKGGKYVCGGLTASQNQKSTTSPAGNSPAGERWEMGELENKRPSKSGLGDKVTVGTDGNIQVEFKGGGKRSSRKPPLSLCPIELVEAVAETRAEGDLKYDVGNWQKFEKEGWVDCLSHAIQHLLDMDKDKVWENGEEVENEAIEVHLGHAATNIAFILWALRRGKVSREDFQNIARVLKSK